MDTIARKQIGLWLLIGTVMTFMMMTIGAVTRLTGSGLSIVEWKVIMGTIPPLNEQEWNETFEKYKQSPQYEKVNTHMTVDGFKKIFFWEYLHRLWGRLIGIVFIIPFFIFLIQKKLNPSLLYKLLILCLLGGLQGTVGWIMVKSGLIDQPWVSPYKLTIHLMLATGLYIYLFLLTVSLLDEKSVSFHQPAIKKMSLFITCLILLQMSFGGFMSGLKAALFYPTFPKIGAQFIPETLLIQAPWWRDIFENVATVQFIHRGIGYILSAVIIYFWLKTRKLILPSIIRTAINLLLLCVCVQVTLGILTIINSLGSIPVILGTLHQIGAILLLSTALFINHLLYKGNRNA